MMKSIFESLALRAGEEILKVYARDFSVSMKDDNSPVTEADHLANEVIMDGLTKEFPNIKIISEESSDTHHLKQSDNRTFFIIDPLDGTKEFVKKNGEFTVNIAYVENGFPVLGVVYSPVLKQLYIGGEKIGSFKNGNPISVKPAHKKLRVVGSRSHLNRETKEYLEHWDQDYEFKGIGSSLKFCLVAEGQADFYPRIGPIKEWDTAAAQAVVEGAGGLVIEAENFQRLEYGKESLLSPSFLCLSGIEILGNLK